MSALQMPEPEFPTSFMPDSELQWVWSASSLETLMACPYEYYNSGVRGRRLKGGDHASLPMEWGTALHNSLGERDKVLALGGTTHEATEAAVRQALSSGPSLIPVDPTDTKLKPKFRARTLESLVKTTIWYCDFYKDEYLPVIMLEGEPAVEVPFMVPLPIKRPDGGDYFLRGYFDAIVEHEGKITPLERKTTLNTLGTSYFGGYNPNVQFSTYALVTQIMFGQKRCRGIMLDAIQIAMNFSRFGRCPINRTEAQHEMFLRSICKAIKANEQCVEEKFWEQRESSCGRYGGCTFKRVCEKDPNLHEMHLRGADFVTRERTPLEIR